MTDAIVAEVRSHPELKDIAFTSIQTNHNTVSAPTQTTTLLAPHSIAIGLGDYVGGCLRLDGAKQPLHIRDHAVVFNGRNIHSSVLFNGDRWSLALFVHSSWEHTSPAMQKQLIGLGSPCPPSGPAQVAVPAVEEAVSANAMPPFDVEESADEVGVVRHPTP